ncbi:uncharacterized protein LOC123607286 [Leopardus geoffroyi]|uniref:uncharacterized protein LOC123607286 n=1 Tax=Leopardus geoffroyi TaxID=46844 RepID=UPI001E26041B|nr:uncharacterized protein LOC123607286 [Leopardus geoffroyi]
MLARAVYCLGCFLICKIGITIAPTSQSCFKDGLLVQESRACPSGLELPTVLLEMERSRRAQEQLLWDLELLTGAGLGLFWPPRAQFCGLRDRTQCAWSQRSKPRGRMGRGPEQPNSWSSRPCPLPQAGDSLSQNHQLPEGGLAVVPSSALDLGEAASHRDPRRASPALPAESTPGTWTPWPGGQTRAGGGEKSSSQVPGFQSPPHSFFVSYFILGARSTQGQQAGFILCPSSTWLVAAVPGTGSRRILKLN